MVETFTFVNCRRRRPMPESHSWKCVTTIGGGPGRRDTNCEEGERKEGGGMEGVTEGRKE